MIRINLLGVERKQARRAAAFDIGKRVTLACSLILVVAAAGIGLWFWSLQQASAQVDADIATAQRELARLRPIIAEVEKFEARQAQQAQRVQLIEQLRKGQSMPVALLDNISKSVPDMLWLTGLQQKEGDVTIDGRSTTLIALSDFVSNLGESNFFKKPIEIVKSESEVGRTEQGATPVDTVEFTVKAQLANPPTAEPPPTRKRPAAPGR
jgi:type IV pilus assembly protein PilN